MAITGKTIQNLKRRPGRPRKQPISDIESAGSDGIEIASELDRDAIGATEIADRTDPSDDGDGTVGYIDPSSIGTGDRASGGTGDSTGGGSAKRRGRPPGGGNKRPSGAKASAEIVTKLLVSIHALLAGALKEPVLAITESEADLLGKATLDVLACYDLPITETTMAWVHLGMITGAIYAPRVVVLGIKSKQQNGGLRVIQPNTNS